MKKTIDCLLIGHNQVNFREYEKEIRKMGTNSGAYRDLSKNIIQYNNKLYSTEEVFNLFCTREKSQGSSIEPIRLVETFNAAIAYLGTYLAKNGLTFDYINSFQEEKEKLLEILRQENILTVAIITTLYVSPLPILEIINFIRESGNPVKIIVGGPFITSKAHTLEAQELCILFKSIDADFYINSSHGEAALVNTIKASMLRAPIEKVNNLYYKTGKGYTAAPVLEENIKLSENMVNWDLFSARVGKFVNVRTAISCPYACSFCGFPQHAGKYQAVRADIIEKELNLLGKIESLELVNFIDDTFNVPVKRFKEILKMMIKNQYKFRWHSHFRCQLADREMVELMKESGCDGVFLGIESGNEQILKNMNKYISLEKYLEGMALLKEYEITMLGNFIIGYPGETYDTVQDTVKFIEKSNMDFYRVQPWYCDPITPIWKEREKYDIKGECFEWSHKTMDSQTASNLIDEIIMSVKNPIRLPQYYFDLDNVFQLAYKGVSRHQVKKFLKAFDNGVKERLENPRKEVSFNVIKQIKNSCRQRDRIDEEFNHQADIIDDSDAQFDF
jgi:radical SAM PhpK family P-methyltransferase